MSAVAAGLSFELLGFAGAPVTGEVVVLELEGRFRAASRRRLGQPRLLVEHPDGARELAPAASVEAIADPDGALYRGSWALDLGVLEAGSFSLAVGRQLIELPAPDLGEPERDRDVRLAREANALRKTIDEAREAASAALASAGAERRAREAAEADAAEARQAREDVARRLTSVEAELTEARREHAAALLQRDEELAARDAERDQQAIAVADERVAVVEAEAAEARRALKGARADTEAVRRELERERERVAVLEAALPRGRVTEVDGERQAEADEVEDRPTTKIAAEDEAATTVHQPEAEFEPAPEIEIEPEPLSDDDTPASDSETTITYDHGESVRVIGGPRRRRTGPPASPADPTSADAEIGARHIEHGEHPQSAAWVSRTLAIAALAVVAIALLLLLKAAI